MEFTSEQAVRIIEGISGEKVHNQRVGDSKAPKRLWTENIRDQGFTTKSGVTIRVEARDLVRQRFTGHLLRNYITHVVISSPLSNDLNRWGQPNDRRGMIRRTITVRRREHCAPEELNDSELRFLEDFVLRAGRDKFAEVQQIHNQILQRMNDEMTAENQLSTALRKLRDDLLDSLLSNKAPYKLCVDHAITPTTFKVSVTNLTAAQVLDLNAYLQNTIKHQGGQGHGK